MTDIIDKIIMEHGFTNYINNKDLCKETVLYIYHAWNAFAGQDVRPSYDIVKRCVLEFLSVTHNYFRVLLTYDRDTANRVIERVANTIVEIGHKEAELDRKLSYTS